MARSPAGKDATEAFFSLHRHEVLLRPQYARLRIGVIRGQEGIIKPPEPGALSSVPYAEPTWLTPGFHNPYYNDNHRAFHRAVRAFFMKEIYPEAQRCEESGHRISQEVVDKLGWVRVVGRINLAERRGDSKLNFLAMRLGPGPHLKGLTLMDGIVKPEVFDYFHEVGMLPPVVTALKPSSLAVAHPEHRACSLWHTRFC